MKILFTIGFPAPFAGASLRRISYFTSYLSKKGHTTIVLSGINLSNLREAKRVEVRRRAHTPFVSVLVCTYNGGAVIRDCLEMLINQDYPEDKREIIVVDDGSTDGTREIVAKYPVKLISHTRNLGIAASRNTAIKNSNGEIIAFCDDDCVPNKDWLRNLIVHYSDEVIGVGGLVLPFTKASLTEKFMAETSYGNPCPIEFGTSDSLIHRFLTYLKYMIFPIHEAKDEVTEVFEIYGANSSFRKEAIEKVGYFDERFRFGEDSDICIRMYREFPTKKILFAKKAISLHKHCSSLSDLLKQRFSSGMGVTMRFYKHSKTAIPPFFPFPVIALVLFILLVVYCAPMTVISFALMPFIFYCAWLLRFIKTRELHYLFFPYMQFLSESIINIGTIVGLIRARGTIKKA